MVVAADVAASHLLSFLEHDDQYAGLALLILTEKWGPALVVGFAARDAARPACCVGAALILWAVYLLLLRPCTLRRSSTGRARGVLGEVPDRTLRRRITPDLAHYRCPRRPAGRFRSRGLIW